MNTRLLSLFLILTVIFSIQAISATEVTCDSLENITNNSFGVGAVGDSESSLSSDDAILCAEVTGDSESSLSSDDAILGESNNNEQINDLKSITVFVGQNRTSDGGNGSYENPYNSLNLTCGHVNGEDKVIINIFDGTYTVDSYLKFNASNLIINGLGNNVF